MKPTSTAFHMMVERTDVVTKANDLFVFLNKYAFQGSGGCSCGSDDNIGRG